MKFIHLTDTHVVGGGKALYGENPAERLASAVASINAEHGDAEFVVITGDLTHWGDAEAYTAFKAEIEKLTIPYHLMVGNHDDGAALRASFPDIPRDDNGFVQTAFETDYGRFILMDTKAEGTHAGAYCTQRQDWLRRQFETSTGPVFLFMHHPPFDVGIPAMDAINLQAPEDLAALLAPYRDRIRHLFFGHLHRAVFGNWHGISYSCMRALNHQVALQLDASEKVAGTFENPAYGVVLLSESQVTVHMHDYAYAGPRFDL